MARTRRLDALQADIRYQADVEGLTLRHTDDSLTRIINQSICDLRLRLSRSGQPYYLKESASANTVAGTASYAYPTDMVWLYGVDLTVNQRVLSLQPFELLERNDYSTIADSTGVPSAYRIHAEGYVRFLPTPDGAYAYKFLYLPHHTDLASASDTFDGIDGWEDWIVYDCCVRVLARDTDPEQLMLIERMRDQKWADIQSAAKRRGGAAPRRIDTRGRRHAARRTAFWRGL